MGISRGIEWDYFAFVSYISGWSVQAIIINKINGVIQLEDGYVETKKIEIPLTKEFIAGMESCFEEINIFDWAKGNYNPCADGEQWSFEFYRGDERILLRSGTNAYPKGYGKWIDFYASLLKDNGVTEVHTCYRIEREGYIFREYYD